MAVDPYASVLKAMMGEQDQFRKDNAVPMYFQAGTPTLETKQFEQQVKEAEQQAAFQQRQLDQQAALSREQMALDKELTLLGMSSGGSGGRSGGSGGSGGGSSGTASERSALATAAWIQEGDQIYQKNLKTKSSTTGERLKYPLYYTLSTLLNNSSNRAAMVAQGVDIQAVVDQLIGKYTGMTATDYLNTPTGKKLKGAYQAVAGGSSGGGRFLD